MKKFMKIAFVAAFAAIAGYGIYANQKVDTMSNLMLANVDTRPLRLILAVHMIVVWL